MAQKNINLLLLDGDPNGRIKCTIQNWVGVAYKIPRDEIEHCRSRDDLKQCGVYFLFGDSDGAEKPVVYIGQAGSRKSGEGILNRLLEHKKNSDKDYWREAVVFTTSNNSLGPTEISFLENKFCNAAIDANRYAVKNSNDPPPGHITEEKRSELDEFAEYVAVALTILGYRIFEPTAEIPHAENLDGEQIFYLTRRRKDLDFTINAKCMMTANGFVVLAGSQISPNEDSDLSAGVKKARRNAKISADNILLENVTFAKPSPAATFVVGIPTNGKAEWKNKDGVPVGNFLR